jgi:bile acid:Na+ symporter, BASS family
MSLPAAGLSLAVLFALLAVCTRFVKSLHGLAFTFSVLAVGSAAVAHPPLFTAWGGFELKQAISPLVQVIIFGMGMTLTPEDFRRVFAMPRGVVLCCVLHYTIMPLGGYLYARLFGLEGAVATGLILIGSVPSGTSSNVIALLARANVPLSVTVTAISTLISPLVTPVLVKWLAGAYVPIQAGAMMFSILKMIVAPLLLGLAIHRYLPVLAARLVRVLPYLAMFAICTIIGVTIALSREQLLTMGLALFGAAACHNATGYLLGYWGGRLAGLNQIDARTCALEVGIQNGGMATGLAFGVLKSPAAALASAVFGPWSAITSSTLASCWRCSAFKGVPETSSTP